MHFDKYLVALGFSVLDWELSHLGQLQKLPKKQRKQKLKNRRFYFSRTNQCITVALRSSQNYALILPRLWPIPISALRCFYINNKPLLYIGISPKQYRLSGILSGKILRDKEVRKYGVSLNTTMKTKSASLETWKTI